MALHDDVDDANGANDNTSSGHEFDLRFAPRAAAPVPAKPATQNDVTAAENPDTSDAEDDAALVSDDFDDNFGGSAFDLDAALGDVSAGTPPLGEAAPEPFSPSASPQSDPSVSPIAPPPVSAAGFAPVDLNLEFQQSEAGSGSDDSVPPWLMAPAPDPNQAVARLDAPEGLSDSQRFAPSEADDGSTAGANGGNSEATTMNASVPAPPEPESVASADPFEIPSDYITPDFFASKVRRRLPEPPQPLDSDADAAEAATDETAPSESIADEFRTDVRKDVELNLSANTLSFDSALSAAPATDDFESLLGFDRVEAGASLSGADVPDVNDTVIDDLGIFGAGATVADNDIEERGTQNNDPSPANFWKLGPLEPNPTGRSLPTESEPEVETEADVAGVDSRGDQNVESADDIAALTAAALADAPAPAPGSFPAPVAAPDSAIIAPEPDVDSASETHAFSLNDVRAHFEASDEPAAGEVAPAMEDGSEAEAPLDTETAGALTPARESVPEVVTDSSASVIPVIDENPRAAESTIAQTPRPESVDAPDDVPQGERPAGSSVEETSAKPEPSSTAETAVNDDTDIPPRPVRRSMPDEELLTWVDNPENQSTGTLSVIEVLEAQLRLREQEANEYREWETTLRAKAGPVADEVIDEVRPQFSDVIGSKSTHQPETAAAATAPEESVQQPPEVTPTPEAVAAPEATGVTLPAWDVPPPSDNWAPGEDFDSEIPFAAHADPTGSIALPTLEENSDGSSEDYESAPTPTSAPEVAAPGAVAPEEPVTARPGSNFDPDFGFLSLDDAVTQSSPELPADEDGDYEEQPFTPPPLVEPVAAPTTPRPNLDELVSFGDFGFTPPVAGADAAPSAAPSSENDAASDDAVANDSAVDDQPFDFGLTVVDDSGESADPTVADSVNSDEADESATDSLDANDEAERSALASADPLAPGAFNFASNDTPRHVAAPPQNFDDLLKSDAVSPESFDEESEVSPLDELLTDHSARAQLDPLSDAATGSIPINSAAFEAEFDDAVDDGDRGTPGSTVDSSESASTELPAPAVAVVAGSVGAAGLATASAQAVPQPLPSTTASVGQQPLGLDETTATAQPVFSLEESGLEPTPIDRRVGHAARLFWLWFAANSSIVSIGLGAAVFAVGMSLRQSIVSILAGVALSFIPLGLTTLASKRSGQPTMVVSRATFGLVGNIAPAVVALIARLFWGAVLLWVLASSIAIVLIGSDINAGLGDRQLLLLALAAAFLVALVIAFAGYPLFARIQLILSIISGLLIAGLIGLTAQYIDIAQALTVPDSSWLLTITGTVLVFSFLGLVWAFSGGDLARYQRPSSGGPAAMLSATFGATLPAFVLIAYGALLAASDPALARGFLASPLDTLLLLLPSWYPIPLLLAAVLSLLSGVTLSLYSGGFALQAVGIRVPRQWSIVIVGIILGALAVLFAFGINGGINELFRDVATTLAVPTAAWAGIFAVETMIRSRRLDGASLTTRGGIYADVRWFNLGAFFLISTIGFSFTSATIGWLSWQGYGFSAIGIDRDSLLAQTDLGVLLALGLGVLTPIVAGIPAIRRQEAAHAERVPSRA